MSATDLLPATEQTTPLSRIDAVLLMRVHSGNSLAELLGRGLEAANVRVRYKGWPNKAFRKPVPKARPRVLHIHWVDRYFSHDSWPRTLQSSLRFGAQLAAKKRQGIRLVWTVHDIHFPESKHITTEHLFQTILARAVDGMIVRSDSSARYVSDAFHLPVERMSAIPHGHYADSYPNTVSRSDARAQLGIRQDDTVFLFFGALREYKGMPQLFESFRQVRSKHATLLVAGWPLPKELADWIHAQAARDDRVRVFPRFIEPAETQLYFNAANAFVLPVRDESTAASGSIALAATFGKAVIAPDQEWIIDPMPREGSIVYDKHGPDALRSALEQALDADLAAMGDRNRGHIMEWGWDRVGLLTRRVYEGERVRVIPGERTST